jgi:hypothetical protein
MIIGPSLIKDCPQCLKPFKQWTTISQNTFGASYWTDGRMMARSYPDFPKLVKCPHCKNLLWVDEAKIIGQEFFRGFTPKSRRDSLVALLDESENGHQEPPSIRHDEFSGVQNYLKPSDSDYLAFLDGGHARNNKEVRYIRMRAWWAANDPMRRPPRRRKHRSIILGQSLKAQDNMRLLFELFDQTDERQRLLKAKLARELGRFDLAEQLLSSEYSENLHPKVIFLKSLTGQRNIKVAHFPRCAHESAVIQIKIPCRLPMPQEALPPISST